MDKKIFLILFLVLFSLNFTSAYTFDNMVSTVDISKSADIYYGEKLVEYKPIWEQYAPIKIDNAFGLGETLVEGAITEHTSSCADNCDTKMTICNYDNTPAIEGVNFYRIMDDGERVLSSVRSYQWFIKTGTKDVLNINYEDDCIKTGNVFINGTEEISCSKKEVITTTKEDIYEEYNYEIKNGCYDYMLKGSKKAEWTYDFVPIIAGKTIDMWAIWGSGISANNVTSYVNETYSDAENNGNNEGVRIIPQRDMELRRIDLATPMSLPVNISIQNDSGYELYKTRGWANSGANCNYFNVSYNLTANTPYRLVVYSQGTYTHQRNATFTPYINNSVNWTGSIYNNVYSSTEIRRITNITISQGLSTITINSPSNNTFSKSVNNTFNISYNVQGGAKALNSSLYANFTGTYKLNQTRLTNGTINSTAFSQNLTDGIYTWAIKVCDTDGVCGYTENRTLTVDVTNPSITIYYPSPTISSITNGQNISLNYSITDTNLGSCWYEYTNNNYSISNCARNNSFIYSSGNNSLKVWANDTAGNLISSSSSWTYDLLINNVTYNSVVTTGSLEDYSINITFNSLLYYPSVNLIYNGVSYLGSTNSSGDNQLFTAQAVIPAISSSTNLSFYWEIALLGSTNKNVNSSVYNQTVQNISVDDCSSYTTLIYNFTLRDEDTKTKIDPILNQTLINIDLSLSTVGTTNNLVTFHKSYNATNPARICINRNFTNSTQYRVDIVADYQATDYVREFYYADNVTITNSSLPINVNLYDLLTSESKTFLFTFTSTTGLEVPNSIVHTFRKYIGDGSYSEVERSKADNNGETHIHLIEEDVIYYFMVTLNDQILYTSDDYNAKCLSTPCEISLSALSEVSRFGESWNNANGTSYSMTENRTTRTVSMAFSSTSIINANLTLYKYSNNEPTVLASSNTLSRNGNVNVQVPVGYDNSTYFTVFYINNSAITSDWVNFTPKARDYFGVGGVIMALLIFIAFVLMTVGEGVVVIIAGVFALAFLTIIKLMDLNWVAFVCITVYGCIIGWKLLKR